MIVSPATLFNTHGYNWTYIHCGLRMYMCCFRCHAESNATLMGKENSTFLYERKKYARSRALPLIKVPMNVYHEGHVSSLKYLRLRIRKSNVLPVGWLLEDLDLVDEESKLTISGPFCHTNIKLTVYSSFVWTTHIDDAEFPFPQYSFPHFNKETLSSINEVLEFIKCASSSHLCIGNPDSKFFNIRDERKGHFLDRSSK